ncbi:MAG: hypothetical protein IIC93_00385, partial [Chloroflexi bacterium]|nr:hypothetical protein [Chloroflexota bacterium]
MKLSAKLVTALAAIALLVVALAGVVSNSSQTFADVNSDATISLDKAWYTDESLITITVTDPDSDTTALATTTLKYDASKIGVELFQNFTLAADIGDTNGDGVID